MKSFSDIEQDIELLKHQAVAGNDPARQLLSLAEQVLEHWLVAHNLTPTREEREGFRLLALHRQGAKMDPSFNACRESCRELIYQTNLYRIDTQQKHITLATMVAMHLLLFIRGKMEHSQLGEFCCSSKAIREHDSIHI